MQKNKRPDFLKKHTVSKVDCDRTIKATVANSYWNDAYGLWYRAEFCINPKLGFEHDRRIRAKILVDLIMSCECSLKCLIFALSKKDETPESLYKKCTRKWGHNLTKLLGQARKRAVSKLKFPADKKLEKMLKTDELGVFVRYSIEQFFLIKEYSLKGLPYSDPLIKKACSEEWIRSFLKESKELFCVAQTANTRYTNRHLSYLSNKSCQKRLKKFYSEIS